MSYDDYISREPDMGERRTITEEPIKQCDDCGEELGWFSVHVPTGGGGRRYCQPCAKWREVHGLLFDPRPKHVLELHIA